VYSLYLANTLNLLKFGHSNKMEIVTTYLITSILFKTGSEFRAGWFASKPHTKMDSIVGNEYRDYNKVIGIKTKAANHSCAVH